MLAAAPAAGSGRAASRAAAADEMVQKINEVRARHGLRALRPSGALDETSRRFAVHLMAENALYHRARPSTGSGWSRSGEVLAMHTGTRKRIDSTISKWMNSSGHRAVLLSRSMGQIGAGVAHGRYGRARAVIWVVQVGKR